jgi:hypothetical protein
MYTYILPPLQKISIWKGDDRLPGISARFEKMADASGALKMLKQMGVSYSSLDAMDDFSSEFAAEFNAAGTDNGPSLSGLVMRSGGYAERIDKSPLLAADPLVSGMETRDDCARNHSTRLIANVPEELLEASKKIISDMGGDLESR